MDYRPLADEIRPTTLDEVVGQRHILGEDGLLVSALLLCRVLPYGDDFCRLLAHSLCFIY